MRQGAVPIAPTAALEESRFLGRITLWNLLASSEGRQPAVFARLEALAGRPAAATAEDVLAGKSEALEPWREQLDSAWQR